jgi:hypothetical protein
MSPQVNFVFSVNHSKSVDCTLLNDKRAYCILFLVILHLRPNSPLQKYSHYAEVRLVNYNLIKS